MNNNQPWEFTCKTCGGHNLTVTRVWNILTGPVLAGHNPTVVGAYFPLNVLTSFPVKSGRNPDIWFPGSRSIGSEREMASRDPV